MEPYVLGDASVSYTDWTGTAALDQRMTTKGLEEFVGLDPDEWTIVAFEIGGGEYEHGRHRLDVYAVAREHITASSDVFPQVAADHGGEIPVTQFLVHDVDPYEILRRMTHQLEIQFRTRGSRELPIRVVALGDVPEQT